jgi:hypothetical protein
MDAPSVRGRKRRLHLILFPYGDQMRCASPSVREGKGCVATGPAAANMGWEGTRRTRATRSNRTTQRWGRPGPGGLRRSGHWPLARARAHTHTGSFGWRLRWATSPAQARSCQFMGLERSSKDDPLIQRGRERRRPKMVGKLRHDGPLRQIGARMLFFLGERSFSNHKGRKKLF